MISRARKSQKRRDSKERISFRSHFREGLNYLYSAQYFVYFIFALFFACGFLGYFIAGELRFLDSILRELFEKTKGMGFWEISFFILQNNVGTAFFGMLLGFFAGIMPLINTVFNGLVLGYVAERVISEVGILSMWRILPHGIFELPAVFIALGIGLRIGMLSIYRYVEYYARNEKILTLSLGVIFFPFIAIFSLFNFELRKKIYYELYQALNLFLFIVLPLLVVAAFIEGILIAFL